MLDNTLIHNMTVIRRKVKYARIHINNQCEIRIIVPLNLTELQIDQFIRSKQKWIEEKCAYFQQKEDQKIRILPGTLLYLGEVHRIEHDPALDTYVLIDSDSLIISSGLDLTDNRVLISWYKKEAKKIMSQRIMKYAEEHQFRYSGMSIRDQKTRWGSCSSKGNLSFNWRLIKAPLFVLDYVVVHELLHLHIMNHKQVFWRRLYTLYPDYEKAKQWLRCYGNCL